MRFDEMESAILIERRWWKGLLTALKVYLLAGWPLIWVLILFVHMDGPAAIDIVTAGYFISAALFAFSAVAQRRAGLGRDARLSLFCVAADLLWIGFLQLVLPRLASA